MNFMKMMILNSIKITLLNLMMNIEVLDGIGTKKIKCLNGKNKKVKNIFNEENIDGYLIPKNDEFFGEYVPDYNDRLNYISNFSGSYGFCLNS